MSRDSGYWTRKINRRGALRGAAAAGGGLAALGLVGCGGGESGGGTEDTRSGAGFAGDSVAPAVDITKGKPGGKLVVTKTGYPQTSNLVNMFANAQVTGLVHSALLSFQAGKAGVDGNSVDVEPDAAQAMPEQPDDTTYIFKLKPGIKFHNGRAMTAEDVRYSLDRYANWVQSAYKSDYAWIDRVEALDASTVRVKSKGPFADALAQIAVYHSPFILAKEHEEGPDASKFLMGSGPFIWDQAEPPVSITVKKNPEYYNKPFPYFDAVTFLFTNDIPKLIADFTSKQIHVPNFVSQEARDQIKKQRPDAKLRERGGAGQSITLRTDKMPWKDKRVRQAMSMTLDRKAIRNGVFLGEGEDDQNLSIINTAWGFRKPSELKSAKWWTYDPAQAKQLMAAAGVATPVKDITALASSNQELVDVATLASAKWRELGIIDMGVRALTGNQLQTTINIGAYDDIGVQFNQQNIVLGNFLYSRYWSPPEGVKGPPTSNTGYISDQNLSRLLDKQLTQIKVDERKATFREMEEIFGEEQYRLITSTYSQSWFWDPSVKGIDMPLYAYQGAFYFPRWWWFDTA